MENDSTDIFDLDPNMIARYLQNNGWKIDNYNNGYKRVFVDEYGKDSVIEIFLRSVASKKEQHKQIGFALNTISQFYEKTVETVSREVRSLAFDVIASSIPDEYVRNDSIELKVASRYIEKMKDFLSSSATTELIGDRFYKRMRKEAVDYAERCRFGHTFRGSFGFLIESPVGLNQEPTIPTFEQEVPFERRVMERILHGLCSFSEAAEKQDPSFIVKASDGFSSNMCDILADVVEEAEVSKVNVSIKLSSEWKVPDILMDKQSFDIEHRYIDVLRDAANTLRLEETPREVKVLGRIKRLETEGNPADLLKDLSLREIEVNWINEDGKLISVKMEVSPEDYLEAVEAHKNGNAVSASGLLLRKGRSWRLLDAKNFKVVDI